MTNVVQLVPCEIGDDFRHDVQEVLDHIPDNLKTIVVLGETDDGGRWYAANANLGQVVWLMEKIKHEIIADD